MKTKQFAIYKNDPLKIKYLVHYINIEENYAILGLRDFPDIEQDYGISLDLIDIIGNNLIQVKDYLLLIDEEAEINGKETLYIFESDTGLVNTIDKEYKKNEFDSKIIAYYPLNSEAKELGLPVLPPFEEINIEELSEKIRNKKYHNDTLQYPDYNIGFEDGYKAAQAKQFSLEDIENAFYMGWIMRGEGNNFPIEKRNYIQSLSTQQLPNEFIPEYDIETVWRGFDTIGWKDIKRFKTITNSEGKEELVGTYKY